VRLVDHDQAGAGGQLRQHAVPELRVVQPLGADQQHVDRAGGDLVIDALPVGRVRGVDRRRADARALGGGDLVAHQRQQRRDDDRGPRAALAQQGGGDEVHRRLAPAGPLHDQRPRLIGHQRADGAPLVLAQPGTLAGQRAQQLFRPLPQAPLVNHADNRTGPRPASAPPNFAAVDNAPLRRREAG